jgi:hypothetical protein
MSITFRPAGHRSLWTAAPPEILLLAIVAGAVALASPLNPDTGYALIVGRRLIGGDRLYVDMFETNPPLWYWMFAGAAWIGRMTFFTDQRLVGGLVALIAAVSTMCGAAALGSAASRMTRFVIVFAFLAAVIEPFAAWSGQREQMAALLVLPYLLVAVRRACGDEPAWGFALLIGILAGCGLAMKPFFLAAWAGCELAFALETRRVALRPELVTVALLQAVFALTVVALTPQYLTHIVPMARRFYGAYGRSYRSIVRETACWGVLVAACGSIFLPRGSRQPIIVAARIAAATTAGWLLAYVVQGKGWYYQLMPALATGAFAVMLTTIGAVLPWRLGGRARLRAAAAIVLSLAGGLAIGRTIRPGSAHFVRYLTAEPSGSVREFADFLGQRAPGEPVFFMSTGMWPAFPAVNIAGARWPYHYHFLWPIPELYATAPRGNIRYRVPGEQSPAEREFFDTVVNDLLRTPPRVLVVANSPDQQAMRGRQFEFVRYFSGSPQFVALLATYHRADADGWVIYERATR